MYRPWGASLEPLSFSGCSGDVTLLRWIGKTLNKAFSMKMMWAVAGLLMAGWVQAAELQSGSSGTAHPLTDLPLKYLAQAPKNTQNEPLVIFLHGYGSNEADLFGIKDQLPADYTYLSAQAPTAMGDDAYQWFRKKPGGGDYDGVTADLASSSQRIEAFVAAAAEKYHTPAGKVILVGFSQGAIMSYEVALRHPQAVGAIAVLSGSLLPVLHAELKPSAGLSRLPVFIGHGTDDPQLPVKDATQAYTILQGLNVRPQLHIYPGMVHTISEAEIADLKAWMASALKGT